jgi:hypothetical protein
VYYSGNFFFNFLNGFFLGATGGSFAGSTFKSASSAWDVNQWLGTL